MLKLTALSVSDSIVIEIISTYLECYCSACDLGYSGSLAAGYALIGTSYPDI